MSSSLQLLMSSSKPTRPILFVFLGESNSTGLADNSDATLDELDVRPAVKLLNHEDLDSFWDLDIGTNNQTSNVQFSDTNPDTGTSYWVSTHGWELQLANRVEGGAFNRPAVYLAKCGQGGTVIDDWAEDADYRGINPLAVAVERISAARSLIASETGQMPQTVMFYNQGINDAALSNSVSTWKAKTIALLASIRAGLSQPSLPIVFLNFESITGAPMSSYITAINSLPDEVSNLTVVSSASATLKADGIHWDYAGNKLCADRLIDTALDNYLN